MLKKKKLLRYLVTLQNKTAIYKSSEFLVIKVTTSKTSIGLFYNGEVRELLGQTESSHMHCYM